MSRAIDFVEKLLTNATDPDDVEFLTIQLFELQAESETP